MRTVEGNIRFDELWALGPIVAQRVITTKSRLLILAITMAFVLSAAIGTAWWARNVPQAERVEALLSPVLFIAIGAIVIIVAGLRLRMRRALQERGTPDRYRLRISAEDKGLLICNDRIETKIRWDAISEVVPAPSAWVVIVDLFGFTIPKRFFHDATEEQAFILHLLEQLSPSARERSANARRRAGA